MDALTDSFPSLSSYSYCRNNPVKLVEPDGNFPIETILDVGFLVYDVGAAVVNHIQGNHTAAVDHWVNAGADVVAVATPYAPATATRAVVTGIRQGNKAVQAAKKTQQVSKAANATAKKTIQKITFKQGTGSNAKKITVNVPKGYRKVGNNGKGDVYFNGKDYISPDKDGHKGGVWKRAKTMADLNSKKNQDGNIWC